MSNYNKEYYLKNKERIKAYQLENQEKRRLQRKRYETENKEALSLRRKQNRNIKSNALKYKYNLTLDEYGVILIAQGGCCKICGINQEVLSKPLYVDHCHTTMKVRGLLCQKCNTGLGMFYDDPQRLQKAIDYLKGKYEF